MLKQSGFLPVNRSTLILGSRYKAVSRCAHYGDGLGEKGG
ncbi:unnamed protein product [marine sediment metagenome]|uniref:Uncharacterized protein n=1 Tax=marine sediment metagenome TaxID=412755 RepID=X1F066_9ZZZZ